MKYYTFNIMLRNLCAGIIFIVTSITIMPFAYADGPGYSGTADQLSVSWSTVKTSQAIMALGHINTAPAPAPTVPGDTSSTDPNIVRSQTSDDVLIISGFGFRGSSQVSIRVGDNPNETRRTDVSGSLQIKAPQKISDNATPGMSVLAIGLSPNGTRRTLVGSVPPKPSGLAPKDAVLWLAVLAVSIGLGTVIVKRKRISSKNIRQTQ